MPAINDLLTSVTQCRLCEAHLPHGARPLVQLAPSAKILIAGQAPGSRAHESGIPFHDPSGDRLREWLGVSPAVFYDPNQIALLPMGFCYPGRGNNGDLPPRPECEPAWRTELLDQLPHLKMTLVLGQYAQRYHFGATGSTLTDRVKSWQTWWPDKVPLPHPSPRNNAWLSKNPWFERNLLPALKPQIATVLTG